MATRSRSRLCALCGKNHAKADKLAREACATVSLEAYRTKVATLKEQLLASTAFPNVMNYFIDHFGNDPTFLGMGEPVRDERIVLALGSVAAHLLRCPSTAVETQLVRLPEHQMTHGLLTLQRGIGVVFFFDDIERGLLGLNDAHDRTETIYVRFVVHELAALHARTVH
jgi:hypothetical protein